MSTYKITTSGQVSLPAAIRRRWGTRRVQVEDRGDHVIVRPVPDDPVAAARGAWKGLTRLTTDEARKQIREENLEIEERKLRELYGKAP